MKNIATEVSGKAFEKQKLIFSFFGGELTAG
jgi:hypothetical protein